MNNARSLSNFNFYLNDARSRVLFQQINFREASPSPGEYSTDDDGNGRRAEWKIKEVDDERETDEG